MILITGGYGFLGTKVCKKLEENNIEFFRFNSNEYDLRNDIDCKYLFSAIQPKTVIHIAARLGGVKDNIDNPFLYFRDNLSIGKNVVDCCCDYHVDNLININTVCSYPLNEVQPFKEEDINNGLPNETNLHYGIAKRTILNYSEIASVTNGFKINNLILTNLFGINDDFNDQTSHVIPAIIKKISKAKKENTALYVWGNRDVTRDFITTSFASEVIYKTLMLDTSLNRVNVGCGKSYTIHEIIKFLCSYFSFNGEIIYDDSKPTGQPNRALDVTKLDTIFKDISSKANFFLELKLVCDWYMENELEVLMKSQNKKYL